MTEKSDENESKFIGQFGSDDGTIVFRIMNSVINLYLEWRLFLYFYGGPEERVGVLNEASGTTALIFQNSLYDKCLMRVRRLTDPMKSGGNRNLGIEHLARIAAASGYDIWQELEKTQKEARSCREYSTKHLAHYDLDHALGYKETSLNRRHTTDAIKAIGDFVRLFHHKVRDVDLRLMPLSHARDERRFLFCLHLGNQKAKELERMKRESDLSQAGIDLAESTWPAWMDDERRWIPFFEF